MIVKLQFPFKMAQVAMQQFATKTLFEQLIIIGAVRLGPTLRTKL